LLFLAVVSFFSIHHLLQKEYKLLAQKKIYNSFSYFKSEMQDSESRLIDSIINISAHPQIQASISMISNYQDINDYQPIIYNEEKKTIIQELKEQISIENTSFLGIYDVHGRPAVVYDGIKDDYLAIGYHDAKPITLSANHDYKKINLQSDKYTKKDDFSNYIDVAYKLYDDLEIGFDIIVTRPIKRVYKDGKSQIIGYIKLVQTNTPDFLEQLSSKDDLEFYIFSDKHLHQLDITPQALGSTPLHKSAFADIKNHWVETDEYFLHAHYILSKDDKRINFIFGYNKDLYNQRVSSILYTLMIIFIVISVSSILILSFLIQKNLSEPLDALLSGIEYIKSGKFKNGIKIETKDELSHLADSFNQMSHTIHSREDELVKNYEETLLTFVDLIEQRDSYTKGHTQRVATYCKIIAEAMGYSNEEVEKVYKAGILHDMGKITTPDSILLKPGRLSNLEYNIMKEHVHDGCTLLRQIKPYKELVEIIEQHHERYDGKGYPNGLPNEHIHPLARIMIVADAFDAMTTSRIYKPRMDIQTAIAELHKCMATQFDPEVVNVAIRVLKDIDINELIDQSPKTLIEKERMAYFYKDQLTGLYNREYLESILSDNVINKDDYNHAKVIYFRNFSSFNNKTSWKEGDILLIEFASYLASIISGALLFRINGDNFLILSQDRLLNITSDMLNEQSPIKDTIVSIETESIDSKDKIKKLFNIR
jgi:putative nucleotidyltransferase with HDIG domain